MNLKCLTIECTMRILLRSAARFAGADSLAVLQTKDFLHFGAQFRHVPPKVL